MHDSVADPKYEGVKTSRKHIFDDDDSDEDAIEENPLDAALGTDDGSDDGQSDGGEDSGGEEGSEEGDDVGDNDEGEHSDAQPSPPPKKVTFSKAAEKSDDLAATLKRSRDADRLKGKAVSRQLVNSSSITREFSAISFFSVYRHCGIHSLMHEYAFKKAHQ